MNNFKRIYPAKQWEIPTIEEGTYLYLSDRFHISPIISKILVHRGFKGDDETARFLYPRIQDLHNPYCMKYMPDCVSRIRKAISNEDKILIYGDRDVDGVTGTILLKECLEELGGTVAYYLPSDEGYGLDTEIIRQMQLQGVSLIITVDCGIANAKEIDVGLSLGIDFIVTDHHEPQGQLPDGVPVLNPKQEGSSYPFRDLAAVGVVFKLAQALYMETSDQVWKTVGPMEKFMDLVTLGTVADLVPLRGENRILVKEGLNYLCSTRRVGLQILFEKVFSPRPYTLRTRDIGWDIAPILNSPGRFGDPYITFHLLSTRDEQKALELVDDLFAINKFRIQSTRALYDYMNDYISQNQAVLDDRVLILRADGHELGVTGLVANRLKDRYWRPILLFTNRDDMLMGSGRAMGSVDLINIISTASHLTEKFGGHQLAVGVTLHEDNFEHFKKQILESADRYISDEDLVATLRIDAELQPEEINGDLFEDLMLIEPFGMGNHEPVFAVYNQHPYEVCRIGGKGDHLKLKIRSNDHYLFGIGWGQGHLYDECVYPDSRIDVACTIDTNTHSSSSSLLLKLIDIKPRKKNEIT